MLRAQRQKEEEENQRRLEEEQRKQLVISFIISFDPFISLQDNTFLLIFLIRFFVLSNELNFSSIYTQVSKKHLLFCLLLC